MGQGNSALKKQRKAREEGDLLGFAEAGLEIEKGQPPPIPPHLINFRGNTAPNRRNSTSVTLPTPPKNTNPSRTVNHSVTPLAHPNSRNRRTVRRVPPPNLPKTSVSNSSIYWHLTNNSLKELELNLKLQSFKPTTSFFRVSTFNTNESRKEKLENDLKKVRYEMRKRGILRNITRKA